ncbi:hypothetical protein HGM15179_005614 [Zosterops borbonicus]|uniref:Kelch repeat and BTB domain-containing protein 8 n=1 Tax=Zosterops borbonicus TaxID=364589 RepID=A0A8K1GM15_9PASS|nr:hypothetical protein HGM15179_005614 [Zosterops borbonicus]
MAALGEPSQFSQTLNGVPPSNPVISGMDPFHACSILQQLKTMYDEGQLTDIVVEVDHGKTFSCHRNVLAAISPYFRSMFTSGLTESTQKEVRIVGVEAESMHLVLNYAYTSRVVLTEANVQALFTAASIFQIPSIQDQCAKYMISHLDPQNSIGVFIFADHYGHQELKDRSQDYIRKKFLSVTKEQEFLQLRKDQLISILNSDDLNVDKEEHVYESIVRWFEHEQNKREVHLPEIFAKCIRMPLLDETFLERIPPVFAQAMAKSCVQKGQPSANGYTQRLGMTASEMIICFDAAHKHSGKKQTVPCLDSVTGRVFKLCKPPNDLREVGILVSPDNDIYIAGGYRPSSSEVSIDHRAESDFWMYDHSGNRWIPKAPLLRARIGCKLVHCCGKLYAIGGRVYEGDGRNSLKSVECYDSRENCWTAVCPMPVAMEFHSAVEYKDNIYVLQVDQSLEPPLGQPVGFDLTMTPYPQRLGEDGAGHQAAGLALGSALTMSPPVLSDLGYVPPDGGWGWAVVFGASISIGFAFTFPKAFTIYFKEIQAVFSVSYSQIAWTTSIMCATTYGGVLLPVTGVDISIDLKAAAC